MARVIQPQTYSFEDNLHTGEEFDYQMENNGSHFMKCNDYQKRNFNFTLYGGYEGIPENLLINFCVWILLLILFTVLRKRAWNYRRITLIQKTEQNRDIK